MVGYILKSERFYNRCMETVILRSQAFCQNKAPFHQYFLGITLHCCPSFLCWTCFGNEAALL